MEVGEMGQTGSESFFHDPQLHLGRRIGGLAIGDEVAEQSSIFTDGGLERDRRGHR